MFIGCLILLAIPLLLFVVSPLLVLLADKSEDDAPTVPRESAGLAETVRWDGRYRCGDDVLGLSLRTRFVTVQ